MDSVYLLHVREGFQQVSFKNQLDRRAQAGSMLLCIGAYSTDFCGLDVRSCRVYRSCLLTPNSYTNS